VTAAVTGRRRDGVASRRLANTEKTTTPKRLLQQLSSGAPGRCVLRDRVKPLAFDVVPVTTDVGAKAMDGGARHVAIVSRAEFCQMLLSTTSRPLRAGVPNVIPVIR